MGVSNKYSRKLRKIKPPAFILPYYVATFFDRKESSRKETPRPRTALINQLYGST